ncbi:uncharacterized protein GGS22DRAFT_184887 [Annulohypoxylon maeteangense]|uniref:uncharacterized protein n=1 Tax=Annulohypoxylon maeteangense TaxID=1927788 RepID=UPI002008C69F|nr:uncharacterized protein GGS22DRAFT_184887 [Annulohypoxylon maeteangense]KAI0889309.1 hypothetical protein GGS22DRAFT_184887 [Annulohypoxylon maeteangense]
MYSEIPSSSSRAWNFGMSLPRGAPPVIKMRPQELNDCPRDGQGTLDNPMVIWAARLTDGQRQELAVPEYESEEDLYRAIDANADMAKTAAIRAGCTVVWIICPVHTSKYVYDNDGSKVAVRWDRFGNPVEYAVTNADPHLTVKLGTSENLCHLHGHINVLVDERGFPTDFMKSFQRRQNGNITDGDDRTMELFEWGAKAELDQERYRREAADYELFKIKTMRGGRGWEIEDDKDDGDYVDKNLGIEIPEYNPMSYDTESTDELTGLNPELEDYLVRRWNPYYRGNGHAISIQRFGYSTRRFRNNYDPSSYSQRPHRPTSYWHGERRPYVPRYVN